MALITDGHIINGATEAANAKNSAMSQTIKQSLIDSFPRHYNGASVDYIKPVWIAGRPD